ncbi:hypothetical protein [Halosimplex sp. J119]
MAVPVLRVGLRRAFHPASPPGFALDFAVAEDSLGDVSADHRADPAFEGPALVVRDRVPEFVPVEDRVDSADRELLEPVPVVLRDPESVRVPVREARVRSVEVVEAPRSVELLASAESDRDSVDADPDSADAERDSDERGCDRPVFDRERDDVDRAPAAACPDSDSERAVEPVFDDSSARDEDTSVSGDGASASGDDRSSSQSDGSP